MKGGLVLFVLELCGCSVLREVNMVEIGRI